MTPRRGSGPSQRIRSFTPATLVFLLLVGVPPALRAQDADSIRITTDLGLVDASGNTNMTTFNVGEELLASLGPWGLKQTFGVIRGETDGETTTSLWRASVRGDRSVRGSLGIYLIGAFDRNRFAGISRRFEEGAGVVVRALRTTEHLVELEAGAGLTQQRSTTEEDDSFASARGAATYRWSFRDASHGQLTTEFLPNLEESDDLRVNSVVELVAPLARALALKVSYLVRYDNLPEPGFKKTDRVFTTGLQIVF
jgi:putative salt-induced outer membrane protein YdiY